MEYSLKFLSHYFNDFIEAGQYYEGVSFLALTGFYSNIQNALNELEVRPYANGAIGYKKIRRKILKKYPYKIIYRIEEDKPAVLIIGLIHTARSKKFMMNLLKER